MHLYLIRHAHAEDGTRDAIRPVSAKGQRQIRDIGRLLRKAEAVDAEEIWHSPLRRSVETAALLAERLRLKVPLREVGGLKPQDDPHGVLRRLRSTEIPVAIVGHDPQLSALASLLVTGTAEPATFVLKKCAVLRLDSNGAGWCVRWQISPELL
jgi:phosphohistidine phosphatase